MSVFLLFKQHHRRYWYWYWQIILGCESSKLYTYDDVYNIRDERIIAPRQLAITASETWWRKFQSRRWGTTQWGSWCISRLGRRGESLLRQSDSQSTIQKQKPSSPPRKSQSNNPSGRPDFSFNVSFQLVLLKLSTTNFYNGNLIFVFRTVCVSSSCFVLPNEDLLWCCTCVDFELVSVPASPLLPPWISSWIGRRLRRHLSSPPRNCIVPQSERTKQSHSSIQRRPSSPGYGENRKSSI